VGSEMCIRDQQ